MNDVNVTMLYEMRNKSDVYIYTQAAHICAIIPHLALYMCMHTSDESQTTRLVTARITHIK